MKKKKFLFYFLFFVTISLFFSKIIYANQQINNNYTIDYPYKSAPSFSNYTVKTVGTATELSTILADKTQTNIEIQLTNNINLTSTVMVEGNKSIDLNKFTLAITNPSAYIGFSTTTSTRQFKIKNGNLLGNRNTTNIGSDGNYSNGFITAGANSSSPRIQTVFENITYTGNGTNSGGFYKGLNTDVYLVGEVKITCGTYNLRAGNMTFLGNFYGYVDANGDPSAYSYSSGGVNLSFAGYATNYMKTANADYGDRRVYIAKEAKVQLVNDNDTTSNYRAYSNNIGNFANLIVEGNLDATAKGTSLRTTASYGNNTAYSGTSGTYNGQANIYVLPTASFKISSTATNGRYGTLFTYNTNLYIDTPQIFDMRYFGLGLFFYSYSNNPRSNLYIYNSNIGVWAEENKGIGNPDGVWQDVKSFSLEKFYNADRTGVINSSDSSINSSTFNINNYSRLSNDVVLPMLVPDSMFIDQNKTIVKNNSKSFSGSTNYYLPDNMLTNKKAINATVTMKFGSTTLTTKTDSNGNWTFSNLDLSKVKGGTVGTLDMVDADQRIAKQLSFTFVDAIPPVVTTELLKVAKSTTNVLTDPKKSLLSYTDETTSTSNLRVEYITSEAERTTMSQTLGVYEVKIKVSDEAGNSTIVTSPVLVHAPGETITDGFITGQDFSIDYLTWTKANDSEKRNLILNEKNGAVKGYSIAGNSVTNVTDDPSKLTITYPTNNLEATKTYPIELKVNSYSKKINVTLVPSEVNMTIKQVYKTDQNTLIYSDYSKEEQASVLNKKVMIGDNISDILNQYTPQEFQLNYPGYTEIKTTDYQIQINGENVSTTVVPDQDFTLLFEYEGQLGIEAPNIDFGTAIQLGENETPYEKKDNASIQVMNTKLEKNWTLSAAMPYGITRQNSNSSGNSVFNGQLLYKKGEDIVTLNRGAQPIKVQETVTPYTALSLGDATDGQLILDQYYGNYKGAYKGTIVWTLSDTLTPNAAE